MNYQEPLDLVRPGEQWFFYWKTSAALWESKITQFPQHETIFLPLYWGFHAESQVEWDFGKIHPERDLFRLTTLLTQHGRKFCWILPLTPAPFLPNGGLPVTAARTLSISSTGVHLAALDHEGKVNKMFSFFDPKVFKMWGSFLKNLGSFLAETNIKAPIWGASFSYFEDKKCISYLTDFSVAFEQGFSRYLKQNHPEGTDLSRPQEEEKLKSIFTHEVSGLFSSTAANLLAPFWGGVQSIVVLGGSPKETIERCCAGGKSQLNYFKDLFEHYLHDQWISSSLLTQVEKNKLLSNFLNEHFGSNEIEERYHYDMRSTELSSEFRPFGLISIFPGKDSTSFVENGLFPFLEQNYRWLYQIQSSFTFAADWIDSNQQKIKFFHAGNLDRALFGQMLKLFLMGQRIVLDTSGLNPDLEKRLQIFYLENNLKLQSVKFQTDVTICELGEGRFITVAGDKLKSNPAAHQLWDHLFHYLHLDQPNIKMDNDVFGLWRIRSTSPHELNYLDVRRVNFYNPTSYKKQIIIRTQKHFAFMRLIDPTKAQAKSVPNGVEVELLPNGKIALDFGHYEES